MCGSDGSLDHYAMGILPEYKISNAVVWLAVLDSKQVHLLFVDSQPAQCHCSNRCNKLQELQRIMG